MKLFVLFMCVSLVLQSLPIYLVFKYKRELYLLMKFIKKNLENIENEDKNAKNARSAINTENTKKSEKNTENDCLKLAVIVDPNSNYTTPKDSLLLFGRNRDCISLLPVKPQLPESEETENCQIEGH